jgi:hypothetical protein
MESEELMTSSCRAAMSPKRVDWIQDTKQYQSVLSHQARLEMQKRNKAGRRMAVGELKLNLCGNNLKRCKLHD